MKIKTSELTGAALDRTVAQCTGRLYGKPGTIYEFQPHRLWAHGGPIIEQEKIDTKWDRVVWLANSRWVQDEERVYMYGPTPLIAAMRCYVASRLGDEVEVPDELV